MGNYIFNICCLIAAFISLIVWKHLWGNFERIKLPQFKNFSFGFLSISFAYLMLSLPKLILLDPFVVQISFILTDLFFLIAVLFLIPSSLSFSEKFSYLQKNAFWTIFFLGLIYAILNIPFFAPAIPLFLNESIIFFKNGNFWLHSILWIPTASGAGLIGILFLLGIKKIEEKQLFWKALFIGLGYLLIFIAGILLWYFKFFNPLPLILNLSGIIGILGFVFGIISIIFFRFPSEVYVKKIA